MKRLPVSLPCLSWVLTAAAGADTIFEEKGGIVAIEAESTSSSLGRWKKKTDVADFSGECHLEFTGNKPESGPPESPLNYEFRINKGGKYQLTLRARKRLESKRQDIWNDCYVAVKGNYEAAGDAPKDVLRKDTKMYGGNDKSWGWTAQLDVSHKKHPALYQFQAGETYELVIHGRSKNFNIDRILFVHESKSLREVQKDNPPESNPAGGLGGGATATSRVKRTLKSQDGRTVEAELMELRGDTVVVLIRGLRHEIPLSRLSEEDQKFIMEWDLTQ
jgi:hypothetical protein